MKPNTVILTLERYHELLSRETKVNEPRAHTVYIQKSWFNSEIVETDDEAVKLLSEKLKNSLDKLLKKDSEIEKLKTDLEKELNKVKEKNFFKHIKLFFSDKSK